MAFTSWVWWPLRAFASSDQCHRDRRRVRRFSPGNHGADLRNSRSRVLVACLPKDRVASFCGYHKKHRVPLPYITRCPKARLARSIIFLLRLSVVMPFSSNFLMASASSGVCVSDRYLLECFRGRRRLLCRVHLSELDSSDRGDVFLLAFGIVATIAAMIVITVISRRALDNLTAERSAAGADIQTT